MVGIIQGLLEGSIPPLPTKHQGNNLVVSIFSSMILQTPMHFPVQPLFRTYRAPRFLYKIYGLLGICGL